MTTACPKYEHISFINVEDLSFGARMCVSVFPYSKFAAAAESDTARALPPATLGSTRGVCLY